MKRVTSVVVLKRDTNKETQIELNDFKDFLATVMVTCPVHTSNMTQCWGELNKTLCYYNMVTEDTFQR